MLKNTSTMTINQVITEVLHTHCYKIQEYARLYSYEGTRELEYDIFVEYTYMRSIHFPTAWFLWTHKSTYNHWDSKKNSPRATAYDEYVHSTSDFIYRKKNIHAIGWDDDSKDRTRTIDHQPRHQQASLEWDNPLKYVATINNGEQSSEQTTYELSSSEM